MRRDRGTLARGTLLLAAMLVGACGESYSTTDAASGGDSTADGADGPAALLSITPELHDFGDVYLRGTRDASFLVTNVGDAASGPLTVELEGDADFAVAENGCAEGLDPGGACAIGVRFSATWRPGRTALATLRVIARTTSVMATARAEVLDPFLTLTPTPVDFGTIITGERSAAQTFTVTWFGGRATGPIEVLLDGTDPGQFEIGANECAGGLTPGSTCTVDVEYAPISRGRHAAELTVRGDSVRAELSGTGLAGPSLQLVPGTQDFGTVCPDASSVAIDFTLTNIGGVPSDAISWSLGGSDPGDFTTLPSSTCGDALSPAESCTIAVTFTPTFSGSKFATLRVSDGDLSTDSMLSGAATSCDHGPVISPAAHDFGSASLGATTAGMIFTIDNPGGSPLGPLTISKGGANPGSFLLLGDTCAAPIPAGGSCTVTVAFSPEAIGARTAELRVSATPGGITVAFLAGSGSS